MPLIFFIYSANQKCLCPLSPVSLYGQLYDYHVSLLLDGQFDIPDRTFHSMHTSWLLSSEASSTDVKELIPEFFYLPEFMRNYEGKIQLCEFGRMGVQAAKPLSPAFGLV